MLAFNPVELIITKRDGNALTSRAITQLVNGYTDGSVPDYQMSAFLMAAFLKGMSEEETGALTHAMLHSGAVLDLGDIPGIKVDKHSTGGVGDKVSLILAPMVAACGVPVPMISGRGLGHTGGTLDKLEAIPGFRTDLDLTAYRRQLSEIGLVMIGQTLEIAPADRKIYALRDVTGTVEFIPFIASSIMSKKIAEGIDALVLDVKFGRGAFMKEEPDARRLAETLVAIGERFGKRTVAWLTRMDAPLGHGIGNWPETEEAIRCLKGEDVHDVMEVTYQLAAEMLWLGGACASPDEGHLMAREALESGRAFEKFETLIRAQHGDTGVLHHPERRLEGITAYPVHTSIEGYVAGIDALSLGRLAIALGAGRMHKEEVIDPLAGIKLGLKPGDPVKEGDLLATFYTQRTERIEAFTLWVRDAFVFSRESVASKPLLVDRYSLEGWMNHS